METSINAKNKYSKEAFDFNWYFDPFSGLYFFIYHKFYH